jgi:hypothetical protein
METENKGTEIVQISNQLIKFGATYKALNGFNLETAVQLLETGAKVTVKIWSDCFGNGGNSKHGRRKSRNQIRSVRNHLRSKGGFVVGYYDNKVGRDGKLLPTGELLAVRLYQLDSDTTQREAIMEQIDKLEAQRGRLLTQEEFAKSHLAVGEPKEEPVAA